jgi:hypothetical protein
MIKFESYKKWINEKFTEKSDPVRDMDIGYVTVKIPCYATYHETTGELESWTWNTFGMNMTYALNLSEFIKTFDLKFSAHHPKTTTSHKGYIEISGTLKNVRQALKLLYNFDDKKIDDAIKGKPVKLNEKFTEDSDPIEDMGIGMMAQVDKFMEEKYYYIKNPTLSEKLSYAVRDNKEEFVKYLIRKVPIKDQPWAFYDAISRGHINLVKLFLDENILEKFNYYTVLTSANAFYVAAIHAKSDILKCLFDYAKKENKKVSQEILDELLNFTCHNMYTKSAKILLDNGAKINRRLEKRVKLWIKRNRKERVLNLLKQYGLIT